MASSFFEQLYTTDEVPLPKYPVRGSFPKLTVDMVAQLASRVMD